MSEKGKNYMFWLNFFRGAGIMTGFDTKYAVVFDDNRIQPDMMLDITKDCLRDMNITAMGDIIAILRYAKKKYEETKTQAFEKTKAADSTSQQHPVHATTTPTPALTLLPGSSVSVSPKIVEKNHPTSSSMTVAASTSQAILLESANTKLPSKKGLTVLKGLERGKPDETKYKLPSLDESKNLKSVAMAAKPQKRIIIVNRESDSDLDIPPRVNEELKLEYEVAARDPKLTAIAPQPTQRLLNERLGPTLKDSNQSKNIFLRLGGGREEPVRIISTTTSLSSTSKDSNEIKKKDSSPSSVFQRLGDRGNNSKKESELSTQRKDSDYDRYRHRERTTHRNERDYVERKFSPPKRYADSSPTSYDRDSRMKHVRLSSPKVSRSSPDRRFVNEPLFQGRSLGEPTRNEIPSRFQTKNVPEKEERRTRQKIIATKSIKDYGNLHVGQVLKTRRITKPDGKIVTQRVIVKELGRGRSSWKERSPSLPDIDDPLANLYGG